MNNCSWLQKTVANVKDCRTMQSSTHPGKTLRIQWNHNKRKYKSPEFCKCSDVFHFSSASSDLWFWRGVGVEDYRKVSKLENIFGDNFEHWTLVMRISVTVITPSPIFGVWSPILSGNMISILHWNGTTNTAVAVSVSVGYNKHMLVVNKELRNK